MTIYNLETVHVIYSVRNVHKCLHSRVHYCFEMSLELNICHCHTLTVDSCTKIRKILHIWQNDELKGKSMHHSQLHTVLTCIGAQCWLRTWGIPGQSTVI